MCHSNGQVIMHVSLVVISVLLFKTASGDSVENLASVGSTLELLHVVWRHGERTPHMLYPNDPYTPESFYPEGVGQLTNIGKLNEYKLGESLREKYGKFLGEVYTPQVLYCAASSPDRTKASLQMVLAGLYPPASMQRWNENLNWQPIPCDYMKAGQNFLLGPGGSCPSYKALENAMKLTYRSDPVYLKYQHLLPYLQEMTGDHDNNDLFLLAFYLYDTLAMEEAYGLTLPSWTKTVYPDILKEISMRVYHYFYYMGRSDLKILQSGFLMSNIVNTTYLTINGDASVKGRKLYLYSGHDQSVACILNFLDKRGPLWINFDGHIIIEVHKILGIRFFKFLLENFEYQTPEPVFVPNCGYLCPVDVFAKLYADVLDPELLHNLCYN